MKLCILGVTGRVGSIVTELAAADEMEVRALVRNPAKLPENLLEKIHVVEGNALVQEHIETAMKGCDIVISTLSTDGESVLSESMPLIIKEMKKQRISRIITIGTAGILQSRTEPHLLRYQSSESKRKLTRAAEDHHKAFSMLEKSGLHWTIVCPTYLPDGEATGTYRVEQDFLPADGNRISTGDTAHFTYSLIKKPQFPQSRVGIAY